MKISVTDAGASCGVSLGACSHEPRKPHVGANPPSVGDWIYVPTRISISRGWDDIEGGLAQVTEVRFEPRINGGTHLVSVAQVDRNFCWNNIAAEQSDLQALHGSQLARRDPDFTSYG